LFNLSDEAISDLVGILLYSEAEFGVLAARRLQTRLERCFTAITSGTIKGHPRRDVSTSRPILFAVERPFVIAFDAETRQIYRVIHGARDFAALFGKG
jgi:plasmid stabilization system protein ParE